MTDKEKKEFEEFLKWKAEKTKNEESAKDEEKPNSSDIPKESPPSEKSSNDNKQENTPDDSNNGLIGMNGIVIIIVVFIVFLLLIIILASSKSHSETSVAEYKDSVSIVDEKKEVQSQTWDIKKEKDPMTDTENIFARIMSENYDDNGIYGAGYCTIVVRYMKKYGYDVMIGLTDGQFYGSEYHNENYVTVRFDEDPPIKYWYSEAADASSGTIFIRKTNDFIEHCKRAKSIKVEVPIFQGGRKIFNFKVSSPLVWPEKN